MKNEQLKSAEELAKQYWSASQAEKAFIPFIKSIQLNAIKHGMTLAAKIIEDGWEAPMQHDPHPPMTNAILTVRDNLTL